MPFETYWWGNIERVKCPAPCNRDHATQGEVQACFDSCPKHPKPAKRVSEIVGPKGEDVVVMEEPEPLPVIYDKPKRFKKQDADATGEP